MLVCDLCGGKKDIKLLQLNFEINHVNNPDLVGTTYNQDVCDTCYTKLCNMVNAKNNDLGLGGVLSKGLDLKPTAVGEPYSYQNKTRG